MWVMMIGVNGVADHDNPESWGTSSSQRNSVMFVAADTFRAAAVEQLEWAQRVGAILSSRGMGRTLLRLFLTPLLRPFQSKTDVVVIDTAGRLHTKDNLMGGAGEDPSAVGRPKTPRGSTRCLASPRCPLQANAIAQAELFHKASE